MDLPELLKVKRQKRRFIDENLVLVYREAVEEGKGVVELILVEIPGMNIKWRHRLKSRLWLVNFNERNCAVNHKYIAVQGSLFGSGGIAVLSRETGELVWESEELTSNNGLGFSPDEDILIALTRGKYLDLIDLKNKKVRETVQLFQRGRIAGFRRFSWSGTTMAINSHHVSATDLKVFGGHVRGPYSAILQLDEGFKVAKKSFIEGHIQLHDSKVNQKTYLLRISGKSIVKNQINK